MHGLDRAWCKLLSNAEDAEQSEIRKSVQPHYRLPLRSYSNRLDPSAAQPMTSPELTLSGRSSPAPSHKRHTATVAIVKTVARQIAAPALALKWGSWPKLSDLTLRDGDAPVCHPRLCQWQQPVSSEQWPALSQKKTSPWSKRGSQVRSLGE